MHTRRTLTLTPGWDITLDASGRLAVTNGDLATAQAVANEIRLFTGDAYFIQDRGIPHYAVELGKRSMPSLLRSFIHRAARSVPDVLDVLDVSVSDFDPDTRHLTGEVVITTKENAHETRRIDF